ncbi:Glycosyltransferase, catalytic subunit of cellulose synthase and poly-beta-1,6-N-acetylglucosamine synthase [Catalinimonas alkaloidigena]|uniref:Glycosyltransferase, catalytic subunit of cellulose synthase and poly-beta-1,6-N-acetylglucosamine synthase n=1 Tax=Catalinimonas alkaloidigena TaxID=1075417 RepID=A0A1G9UA13_9BACT|nr:glycosyltransferase [Catalinimonas alkaloidigena]SDM56738.1 Glycosyltransferase, catalytic subunit of cellulose synthase and poly-beta-1,6-N-acetylglucosamine synthase [Catalinimonas alkaloidigena]
MHLYFVYTLIGIFALSLLIQMFYLRVFARLSSLQVSASSPGRKVEKVSVIVCCRNELENMQVLLPLLLKQNHPDYEIIVVDDRSADPCYDYLLQQRDTQDKIRLVRINETPDEMNPKKYALTLGIKAAKGDVLLLTDADCVPSSEQWISNMQESFSNEKEIVLGYAPYRSERGWLNTLIRYETFFSAIQFLSFAAAGRPYMGVGRNLAYRKYLFMQNKGFTNHIRITGGDDDLFVNAVARPNNVALCLDRGAQTVSIPKTSLQKWYRQKRRHLSVSKHYKSSDKAMLGLLSLSHFLFWFSAVILFTIPNFWPLAAVGVLIRIGAQTFVFRRIARKLEEDFNWALFPILDFFYVFYYVIFGVPAVFSKRIQWS